MLTICYTTSYHRTTRIAFTPSTGLARQVTGNVDPGAISPVTVHGGVVQGAVAADVDAGAVAGGVPLDVTVGDVAGDVDPVTIAGGSVSEL